MQILHLGSGDIPRTLAGVGTGSFREEALFSNRKLLRSSCAAMTLLEPGSAAA